MNLFGTAGIRGPVRETVTPRLAMNVGHAVASHADNATTVVVGRDGRTSGEGLAAAVTAGLLAGGCDVRRVGQVPTPALAHASRGRRGVMLTASHNPPADNGIKLFVDGTEYSETAEREIERLVDASPTPAAWDAWGGAEAADTLPAYRDAVADYARRVPLFAPTADATTPHPTSGTAELPDSDATPTDDPSLPIDTVAVEPADGLRVAVDCGNGVSGVATPQVLRSLGATVVTLNANVDGRFPGRESKPTAESLADLRAFVADDGADVGIGHDGDGDRIVLVDGDGDLVHEDTVVAMLAEAYTRAVVRTTPDTGVAASDTEATASDTEDGGAAEAGTTDTTASDRTTRPTVVTTPNASDRIDERVEAAGGRVERVALGYLHDGVHAVREAGGRVAFAAEPWKHVHTRFGPWIDGVASAAVLARLVARHGLAALRDPVTERPYRKESLACPDDAKRDAMDRLATTLPDAFPDATVETEYGVRLSFSDGSWLLVRPSGTEPYLRVYAESDSVDTLVNEASDVVRDAVE